MRIHPRTLLVQEAEGEATSALVGVSQKYQLTRWEMAAILSRMIATLSRSAIRDERHPDDPQKGGDEE